MGFRFRKKIKIMPGVSLNVGKKGINSVSAGGNGFTANINKNGTKTTTSLHGSGLSYETERTKSYVSGKFILCFVIVLFLYMVFK